ncbi:Transcriptional regulator ATRX [Fasciola hepatica]|uniref:Transcriptional regulator ATRX n=1 Tax=Fasciola hepatica TaxID=6192 RepID=A0A4E0QUP5_FASHE|nr:Transcriptional regulator ATRX [Fasciola hepatica]
MVKSVSSNVSSSDHENNEEADTRFSRGLNKPKVKYHGVDEKLMQSVWSSSEDEDKVPKKPFNGRLSSFRLKSNLKKKKRLDGKNEVGKEKSSGSDSEVVSKSDKRTRLLEDSDSGSATFTDESDEEVKPPKRRRQLVSEKNHRSKKAKSCLESEKSDSKPRNYETDEDEDDNDVDENSERSKSQSEQKRPQKRRRRRVRTGASPNEDGTAEDQDSASDSCQDPDKMIKASADSGSDDGAGESSKGRKRIRKIYAKTKLSETTKSAEAEERERRKRLSERQKMYNHCLVQEGAGTHVVTKKLVLEKSSDGSEDLIEVHQHILKHLKPHQVEAVRFLWDCVIESVENQDVKNEQARGAILAHCMGLGKTLSVIAFLHTILSHPALLSLRTCLVICPVNTLLNWKNECEIWLPPDDPLDVFELSNRPDNRQRVDVLRHWQKDVRFLSFRIHF